MYECTNLLSTDIREIGRNQIANCLNLGAFSFIMLLCRRLLIQITLSIILNVPIQLIYNGNKHLRLFHLKSKYSNQIRKMEVFNDY